jgi:hypothetical protein
MKWEELARKNTENRRELQVQEHGLKRRDAGS